MENTPIKLSDMGTTGLIDYVLSYGSGREKGLAIGRAKSVLRRRGYPAKSLAMFAHAVSRVGYDRLHLNKVPG